jgi:hypothetical protein
MSPFARLCGVCEADVRRGLELGDALGELVLQRGWTPGISRGLLELFEELVARGEVEAALAAKRCRRCFLLWGLVSSAFTPLAVGLLVATSSAAGSLQAGVA